MLPLYLLAALAIKLESPGSIFVQIPRVSIRGHSFDLLKFRTVALSAKDSQVTRIGKILRVTALDELPQLWNIWKGDMSFIGPRPLSTEMLEYFDAQQLHKWLSVRPGLVSFAAMNGQRVLNFDNWIRLNLEYVDKPSVWLYLKTLLKPFLIGIGLRRDRRSS